MGIFQRIHIRACRKWTRVLGGLALGFGPFHAAYAAPVLSGEASLAIQFGTAEADVDRQTPSGVGLSTQIRARLSDSAFHPSGAEIGWSAGLAARFGRGADQGFATALAGPQSYRSPFSRIGLGLTESEDEYAGRLALDEAYVFVSGGWGELALGRDMGVGERFSLGVPDVMGPAGVADTQLAPVMSGRIVLAGGLSGQSAKLSVLSPRLVGLQLGLSYTPRLEQGLLDPVRLPDRPSEPLEPRYQDMVELAASFSRRFRAGYRLSVGLTHVQAVARADARDLSAIGLSGRMEWGGWTLGGALLDGKAAGSEAGYHASGMGISRQIDKWTMGLSWTAMEERQIGLNRQSATLGIRRPVADGLDLAVGLIWDETRAQSTQQALGLRLALSAAF